MRVPVYEEIVLVNYDIMSIVDLMRKSRVGKNPSYLNLSSLEEKEVYLILETLSEAFRILKISPYFPYPFYVITPFYYPEIDIPALKSTVELPNHFRNKVKKLNNKELDLVNKTTTLSERIANQSITAKRRELRQKLKDQKRLFHLCREQSFYEDILQKLKKQGEGR